MSFSKFFSTKSLACTICLFIFSILLIFSPTCHWTQILSTEKQNFCEEKLVSQYSIIESKIPELYFFKPPVDLKRLIFIRKDLFKESKKEDGHSIQLVLNKSGKTLDFHFFLNDRSYTLWHLALLSSKHHPPPFSFFL